MQKEKKDKHFIKKPVYEGGPKAMKKFISQHLQYPDEAMENKIEGTVHIRYTIDYTGKVVDTKIISGLGYGCDEEASRLVKMLKFSVPRNRGVRVQFHKTMQIHFRLPKKKVAPQMNYNYVTTASEKAAPEQGKSRTYTYAVNFDSLIR